MTQTNPQNLLIFEKIQSQIQEHPVLLYMKGTADRPLCGFSGFVCQVLHRLEVPFTTINVLEDQDIRQGIKEFSQWPTIPQLYIQGDFIGGSDIVRDMLKSGELTSLLKEKGISFKEPLPSEQERTC